MRILSSIPGRIRVAHPKLKDHHTMADVLHCMKQMDGMISVEGQTLTGSILIRYNAAVLKELDLMRDLFDDIRSSYLPPLPAKESAFCHKGNRNWRNLLQVGMLGSLLVCTVTGFTGSKNVHLLTGLLFLLVSAEHTRINRSLLMR